MTFDVAMALLGWCTLINLSVLVIVTLSVALFRDTALRLHEWMFGIDAEQLKALYFQFLAIYKIAILVFNLAPYLALRLLFP